MKRLACACALLVLAVAAVGCATKFVTVTGARPGGTAAVSVHTTPFGHCSITYTTPQGNESTAQGLDPKDADGQGSVSWSWKIGIKTTPGDGVIDVLCNGNQHITSPIHIG
jgi:hypothetical protein